MNKDLKELTKKRDGYKAKLIEMNKHFRGVKHENALSELRYSEIKVYEDFVKSLDEEIANFKKN
ncbi:MAG: hypothetical protein Q8Q30_00085 [Candidatus Woesebacteria bacterium]|nr:hypothetical protein [Candidatus Woesebacteria bacterium]